MSAAAPSIRTAFATDTGRVRQANEDSCGEIRRDDGSLLLVLCDGMGGHVGGAVASGLAVDVFADVFRAGGTDPAATLADAFAQANAAILDRVQQTPDLAGMGTTGVALLFTPGGTVWIGHVGDSRAYLLRDGRCHPLTKDHSVVAEMLRSGALTPEQAEAHPRRSELLRSIGVEEELSAEIASIEPAPDDRFLLCSDGLNSLLNDEEIAAIALRERPETAVRTLVETANERGGHDNVTVQLAELRRDAGDPVAAPGAAEEPGQDQRVRALAATTGVVLLLLAATTAWILWSGR